MHHIALMDISICVMPLEIYNKESGEVSSVGIWGLVPTNRAKGSRYSNQAIKMRNAIEDFDEEGNVIWQQEYVTWTSYGREYTTNEHEF